MLGFTGQYQDARERRHCLVEAVRVCCQVCMDIGDGASILREIAGVVKAYQTETEEIEAGCTAAQDREEGRDVA